MDWHGIVGSARDLEPLFSIAADCLVIGGAAGGVIVKIFQLLPKRARAPFIGVLAGLTLAAIYFAASAAGLNLDPKLIVSFGTVLTFGAGAGALLLASANRPPR